MGSRPARAARSRNDPRSISASNLVVDAGGGTFNLLPTDSIGLFHLSNGSTTLNNTSTMFEFALTNATATTTSGTNILDFAFVQSRSTLNLGANLTNLQLGYLDVEDAGSAVHMNGYNINVPTIYLGWNDGQAVTLDRGTTPGSLTATDLYVGGGTNLNLIAADAITNLHVADSSVTTAATSNVTGSVELYGTTGHASMPLGADLNLGGNLDIYANTGSSAVLDAQYHNITADQILLGY